MTRVKDLTSAMVLTFALTGAVFGGTIDTPAPSPPPSSSTSSASSAEDIPILGDIHIPGASSNLVVLEAQNILQAFLSVF